MQLLMFLRGSFLIIGISTDISFTLELWVVVETNIKHDIST